MHAISSRQTARRAWWRREFAALSLALILGGTPGRAIDYREDFDAAGKPDAPAGLKWDYRDELCPVETWKDIVPGDGYAYLPAEREFLKQRPRPYGFWPFQTLSLGPVGSGFRFSMRAKNTAIPGLAAMIFTYREQDGVDEIDLEITANDTESRRPRHGTRPGGGWTDLRMATWINADRNHPEPTMLVKQPARDGEGNEKSVQDDRFHVYSIEWDAEEVRFFIDGVHQHTIPDAVPDLPARVLFGLRQMPWAVRADWEKPQTMVIDWISIEDLGEKHIPIGE